MEVILDTPIGKRLRQLITDLTVQMEEIQKEIEEMHKEINVLRYQKEAAEVTLDTLLDSSSKEPGKQLHAPVEAINGNYPPIEKSMPLILAILLIVIRSPFTAWRGRDVANHLGKIKYQEDTTKLKLNVSNCMAMYSEETRQHPEIFKVKRHARVPYYHFTEEGKNYLKGLIEKYKEQNKNLKKN